MSETNDREGRLRIPGPLYDRWLRRCHREGIEPDKAAAVWLERGLRRDTALMAEDTTDEAEDPDREDDEQ
jgi:hypothetical protein